MSQKEERAKKKLKLNNLHTEKPKKLKFTTQESYIVYSKGNVNIYLFYLFIHV